MAKFTDCEGREWHLRMTLGHRAGLRELGIDPTDFGTVIATAGVETQQADKLLAVCHLLTTPPVTLTADEYAAGWDATTIEAAGEALSDALTDFYLSRRPKLAAAAKEKVREAMARMDERAAEALTRFGSDTNSPGPSE